MKKEIYLLLDNIRSLYNVGSIFRIADAFGINKIYLSGISGIEIINKQAHLHPKVVKTALEGINVAWEYAEHTESIINRLKAQGVKIAIAEITNDAHVYTQIKYDLPLCLVVGNENNGVQEDILKLADLVVKIPMLGQGKSLNVAISTGIIVSEILRQNL